MRLCGRGRWRWHAGVGMTVVGAQHIRETNMAEKMTGVAAKMTHDDDSGTEESIRGGCVH